MANNIPTTIKSWSSTLASNQPDGSDLFSSIADDLRAIQTGVRAWYEGAGWKDLGHTPTRTGNTTFTVTGDQTAYYTANLPIKCTDSTTLYGYIVSAVYGAVTTVTVTLDSGNLSASLSAVAVGYDNQNGLIRHGVTPAADDSSTLLATTAYVQGEVTGYAPLASPTFTGTPAAPTAAADTNTTQVATTAFVIGQASDATPQNAGTAAAGTSKAYSRADHVHNKDSTKADLASPAFTGTPTAPTATAGTNTTQIATTAFVQAAVGGGQVGAWLSCGVTGNILDSYNVTSVTDKGTGWAKANLTTAFGNADYAVVTDCYHATSALFTMLYTIATTYFEFNCYNDSGTITDPANYRAIAIGN